MNLASGWVIVYRLPVPNRKPHEQEIEFLSSIGGWFHYRHEAEAAFKAALERRQSYGQPHRVAYVEVHEAEPPGPPPGGVE